MKVNGFLFVLTINSNFQSRGVCIYLYIYTTQKQFYGTPSFKNKKRYKRICINDSFPNKMLSGLQLSNGYVIIK